VLSIQDEDPERLLRLVIQNIAAMCLALNYLPRFYLPAAPQHVQGERSRLRSARRLLQADSPFSHHSGIVDINLLCLDLCRGIARTCERSCDCVECCVGLLDAEAWFDGSYAGTSSPCGRSGV
jgi:hypothetical protein